MGAHIEPRVGEGMIEASWREAIELARKLQGLVRLLPEHGIDPGEESPVAGRHLGRRRDAMRSLRDELNRYLGEGGK